MPIEIPLQQIGLLPLDISLFWECGEGGMQVLLPGFGILLIQYFEIG